MCLRYMSHVIFHFNEYIISCYLGLCLYVNIYLVLDIVYNYEFLRSMVVTYFGQTGYI